MLETQLDAVPALREIIVVPHGIHRIVRESNGFLGSQYETVFRFELSLNVPHSIIVLKMKVNTVALMVVS